MPDPTPVAISRAIEHMHAIERYTTDAQDEYHAQQAVILLNEVDAGVRETVELLEWIISDGNFKAPEQLNPVCRTWRGKIEQALAELSGEAEQEVNDEAT